jgi:hypothetical protein
MPPSSRKDSMLDTLSITHNLSVALRHLRLSQSPRTLWVDAICINQHDYAERSMQVTRMAQIYKLAHKVVIWLRPESKDSGLSLATLDHLGTQVECMTSGYSLRSPMATQKRWFHRSCNLPHSTETWDAILHLIELPWFDRLWVCQEAQLANFRATIQCGKDESSWSNFRRAIYTLRHKNQFTVDVLA